MKPIVILVLLAFALLANPARSESHLTETQKILQAELERRKAVEVNKKKALAKKESQQNTKSNTVKLHSRMTKGNSQKSSTYMGVIGKNKSAHTSLASNNSSTQSFQSLLKNADWGTTTYSSRSVNNRTVTTRTVSTRSVRQNQRVATTPTTLRPIRQSQQVKTTPTALRPIRQSHQAETTTSVPDK